MENTKVGVLGGGSWATAIVKLLTNNLKQVNWWMRNEESISHIRSYGHNPKYIRAIQFETDRLHVSSDMQEVVDKSDILFIAIPAAFLDTTFQYFKLKGMENKIIFSAIKGMVVEYHSIPARYFHKEFGTSYDNIGIVCGPCHAEEVAKEQLSYLTLGCPVEKIAQLGADMLACRYIKTFTSDDVFGTEISAVLKNIYAVAAGICHGLGYGDNFLAVLISSAIRETSDFVDAVHEIHRDVKSSAYLGDLLVTAYSPHSRNRSFGTMVGKGYSVKGAQLEMNMIAEGYYATESIYEMNKNFNVNMPIAEAVYRILYDGITPVVEMRILAEKLS
jgi:glycerol-3-phosphate dehydrogenase (NAD(P)+)